jgi:integrase
MPRAAGQKIRLTKTVVEGLPRPERSCYCWDDSLPGFGVRLLPSGTKTYIIVSVVAGSGRQVKQAIGRADRISADAARRIAAEKLAKLAAGHDIAQERRSARDKERRRLAAPTLQELAEAFLERHAKVHKRTWRGDQDMLRKWIFPHLGVSRRAVDITHGDVAALHRAMRQRPYQANRCLSLVCTMFEKGRSWGLVDGPNPAKGGITKYREHPRERFLSPDEISALLKALDQHPRRASALAIKLMLLCGCRRGEILGAKWSEFDLDAATWRRPHYRLKQRRDHHLPLSPAAVGVLREIQADQQAQRAAAKKHGRILPAEYLFPAGTDRAHMREVAHTWASVQRSTGLHNCRLHDLRHSFASIAVSSGMSLPMIGALLGHASVATTQRYSHLMDGALREATTAIGSKIQEYARRPPRVVALPKPPAKA